MRLEAGNNFAHLPQSGFKFELSEAEETEKGSKKKCASKREEKGEKRGGIGHAGKLSSRCRRPGVSS